MSYNNPLLLAILVNIDKRVNVTRKKKDLRNKRQSLFIDQKESLLQTVVKYHPKKKKKKNIYAER